MQVVSVYAMEYGPLVCICVNPLVDFTGGLIVVDGCPNKIAVAGVDQEVHRMAGQSVRQELEARILSIIGPKSQRMPREAVPTGVAFRTRSGALPCQGIIHVTGPLAETSKMAGCHLPGLQR